MENQDTTLQANFVTVPNQPTELLFLEGTYDPIAKRCPVLFTPSPPSTVGLS